MRQKFGVGKKPLFADHGSIGQSEELHLIYQSQFSGGDMPLSEAQLAALHILRELRRAVRRARDVGMTSTAYLLDVAIAEASRIAGQDELGNLPIETNELPEAGRSTQTSGSGRP